MRRNTRKDRERPAHPVEVPAPLPPARSAWTSFSGKRNERGGINREGPVVDHSRTPVPVFDVEPRAGMAPIENFSGTRRRPPRAAVVSIRPAAGQSVTEILRRAKSTVSLRDLGIEDTRLRKAANGNLLIEIPGADGARRADLLAQKLRLAL